MELDRNSKRHGPNRRRSSAPTPPRRCRGKRRARVLFAVVAIATAGSSTTAHALPPGVSQAAEQALRFQLTGVRAYGGVIAQARRVDTYGLVSEGASARIDGLRVEAARALDERLDDLAAPRVDGNLVREKMVEGGRECLAGAMESTAQHLGRALHDGDPQYQGVTPLHDAVSKCVRSQLSGASGSDISQIAGSIVNVVGGYADATAHAATGADATQQLVAQQRWIEETAQTLRATDSGDSVVETAPTPRPTDPGESMVDRLLGSIAPWLIGGAVLLVALGRGSRRWRGR
jgi:hypothetical protein